MNRNRVLAAILTLAMVIMMTVCVCGRVWLARTIVGMSARYWLLHIVMPLSLLSGISLVAGWALQIIMVASVVRVCLITVLVEVLLLALSWCFLLAKDEKQFLINKFRRIK